MHEVQLIMDLEMKAVIPLGDENLMYLPLKFDNDVKRRTIIDAGACANTMPADFYGKLREASPTSISDWEQASLLYVKVASGAM